MTKAGVIPLSDIEWIRIYPNEKRKKNNKSGLKWMLDNAGGDLIMGAAIFLKNGDPCCHLKIDGKVECRPDYTTWAIAWNEPDDFCVTAVPDVNYANYMACVKCIVAQNKVAMDYQSDMKYPCNRLIVGIKGETFAYYATEDNLEPEELQEIVYSEKWDYAIMMDGGGSACCLDKNGNGFGGDGRYMPFYIVVKLKEKDVEQRGERPMDFEVKAYSLKKEGENFLTKNFQVKEFACNDGSDTIFIAEKLPMVCQYIRMRMGKAAVINSGYRTTEHNKEVGGEEYSMHLYGAAADIKKPAGWTGTQMALIAREIMPDWGGVGIYSWGIHVDVSSTKRDWNG